MNCIHINNNKKETYLTEEELDTVFNRKMKKLIQLIKTQKITHPEWKDADRVIDCLQEFKEGILVLKKPFVEYKIEKRENSFFIFKGTKTFSSLRYYCKKEDERYNKLRKEYGI